MTEGEPFAVPTDINGVERLTSFDRLRPSRLNGTDGGIHPLDLIGRDTAVLIERTAGAKVVLVKNKVNSLVGVGFKSVYNGIHILDKLRAVALADEALDA